MNDSTAYRARLADIINNSPDPEEVHEASCEAAELDAAAGVCEHGIPLDAPCRACAIAGHEPVDVDEPAPLTDNRRHLADCRGCALHLADGHDYASLIDVPLTVDELRTLAAREDVDAAVRQIAAVALAAVDPCPEHCAPADLIAVDDRDQRCTRCHRIGPDLEV